MPIEYVRKLPKTLEELNELVRIIEEEARMAGYMNGLKDASKAMREAVQELIDDNED